MAATLTAVDGTGAITLACLAKLVRDKKIPAESSAACIVSETGLKGDFPPFPSEQMLLDPDRIVKILER